MAYNRQNCDFVLAHQQVGKLALYILQNQNRKKINFNHEPIEVYTYIDTSGLTHLKIERLSRDR